MRYVVRRRQRPAAFIMNSFEKNIFTRIYEQYNWCKLTTMLN